MRSILSLGASPRTRESLKPLKPQQPRSTSTAMALILAAGISAAAALASGCGSNKGNCDFYTGNDCKCPAANGLEYPTTGDFTTEEATIAACKDDLADTEFSLPDDKDCTLTKDVPVVCKGSNTPDVNTSCKKIRDEAGNNGGNVPSLQKIFATNVGFCTISDPQ